MSGVRDSARARAQVGKSCCAPPGSCYTHRLCPYTRSSCGIIEFRVAVLRVGPTGNLRRENYRIRSRISCDSILRVSPCRTESYALSARSLYVCCSTGIFIIASLIAEDYKTHCVFIFCRGEATIIIAANLNRVNRYHPRNLSSPGRGVATIDHQRKAGTLKQKKKKKRKTRNY